MTIRQNNLAEKYKSDLISQIKQLVRKRKDNAQIMTTLSEFAQTPISASKQVCAQAKLLAKLLRQTKQRTPSTTAQAVQLIDKCRYFRKRIGTLTASSTTKWLRK